MKKIILAALFLFSISSSFGQWTTSGSVTTTTNTIGIGTTSPVTTLDVNGTIRSIGYNSPTSGVGVEVHYYTPGVFGEIYAYDRSASAYKDLVLGTGGNQLYLKNNGNVGIGTTSPQNKFVVSNGTAGIEINPNTTISSATGTYFASYNRSTSAYADIIFDQGGAYTVLKANGNVGIGTTSPALSLEVAGDPTTYGGTAYQSTIQSRDTRAFATGVGGGITFAGNYTALPNNTEFAGIAGIKENSNSGDYAGALIFSTRLNGAIPTERLRISSSGNVGIGTTNPGSYRLAVNGGIHSQSVNVDLTGWSDYVFKRDYQLPSLSELKTYIDQNHHLPDMPSEWEVIKNGINLGEMNKLLTKKVEELTLYLIEKDKLLSEEQKKNQQQDSRIAALEAALAKLTANK